MPSHHDALKKMGNKSLNRYICLISWWLIFEDWDCWYLLMVNPSYLGLLIPWFIMEYFWVLGYLVEVCTWTFFSQVLLIFPATFLWFGSWVGKCRNLGPSAGQLATTQSVRWWVGLSDDHVGAHPARWSVGLSVSQSVEHLVSWRLEVSIRSKEKLWIVTHHCHSTSAENSYSNCRLHTRFLAEHCFSLFFFFREKRFLCHTYYGRKRALTLCMSLAAIFCVIVSVSPPASDSGISILRDPGVSSRDNAIFLGESLLQLLKQTFARKYRVVPKLVAPGSLSQTFKFVLIVYNLFPPTEKNNRRSLVPYMGTTLHYLNPYSLIQVLSVIFYFQLFQEWL